MKILLILILVNAFFFSNTSSVWAEEKSNLPSKIIIKYKSNISENSKQNLIKNLGLKETSRIEKLNARSYEIKNLKLALLFDKLTNSNLIEYVESDFLANTQGIPNDNYYSSQWALNKIEAPGGWDKANGSGVDIAVVDTGVDPNHPDIKDKIIKRTNFTTETDTDTNGHGSHVAGIAGALTDNNIGIAGVGKNSNIFSVKVLDKNGNGYTSSIANGIIWAADNGAEVINLSLGSSSSSKTLLEAVNYALSKGAVIVAASGNSGRNSNLYPASYPNVISVAATDQNDAKPSFSNYGSSVDVAAPGKDILSLYKGGYNTMYGTSMSTAHVSGLAALIKSSNPGFSNTQIAKKIFDSADKIKDTGKYWTYGRINICKALDCVTQAVPPTPAPSVTPSASPASSPIPTKSPSPTPSPTPSQSPTSAPTQSPTPTQTPSPTPKPFWCNLNPRLNGCQ